MKNGFQSASSIHHKKVLVLVLKKVLITSLVQTRARVRCELRKCEWYFVSWSESQTCKYLGKVWDGRMCESPTERQECSLNQLLVDLSCSAHLPSRLNQRRARPYFLKSVWLGSKDSRVHWAGSLPKQQPELLPLHRSLSQEPFQVVFRSRHRCFSQHQEPVADLGFLNVGGQVQKARGDMGKERDCVPPRIFSNFGLEIAY